MGKFSIISETYPNKNRRAYFTLTDDGVMYDLTPCHQEMIDKLTEKKGVAKIVTAKLMISITKSEENTWMSIEDEVVKIINNYFPNTKMFPLVHEEYHPNNWHQ